MMPLTREEFKDALQKGLGRAVMHVREHGAEGWEEDILDACLHNQAYDQQCEGSRDQYMLSIIDLLPKNDFYFSKILEAYFQVNDDSWDANQLSRFVLVMAQRGFSEAKRSLYDKFDKEEFKESFRIGIEIMELDGLQGMLHVAERVGRKIPADENFLWRYGELFYVAKDMFSEKELDDILSSSEESSGIRNFVEEVLLIKRGTAEKQPKPQPPHTLQEILEKIEINEGRKYFGLFRRFGLHGSDSDTEVVFSRFLKEKDKNKLHACLQIFAFRPFPRLEGQIFNLLESEDEDFRYSAIRALANFRDDRVHQFAVRYFQSTRESPDPSMLMLFTKNYKPGDYKLIESALGHWKDTEDCHEATLKFLRINDEGDNPELAGCMVWAFEHSPCSHCRENIVELLVKWNQAPQVMLEECLWDCQEEVRKLARQVLNKY